MGLVELARFNTRVEAELARIHLQSAEIEVVLFDAEINGYLGVSFVSPVRMMVLDDDAREALAILREDGLLPPG